jgi:hypothetical protein
MRKHLKISLEENEIMPAIAIINPEIVIDTEQNISTVDSELTELALAEDISRKEEIDDDIDEAFDVVEALGSIRAVLSSSLPNGGVDSNTAEVVKFATEHLYNRVGLKNTKKVSLESFTGTSRKLATEGMMDSIKENAKRIWEAIIAAIKKSIEWINSYIIKFTNWVKGNKSPKEAAVIEKEKISKFEAIMAEINKQEKDLIKEFNKTVTETDEFVSDLKEQTEALKKHSPIKSFSSDDFSSMIKNGIKVESINDGYELKQFISIDSFISNLVNRGDVVLKQDLTIKDPLDASFLNGDKSLEEVYRLVFQFHSDLGDLLDSYSSIISKFSTVTYDEKTVNELLNSLDKMYVDYVTGAGVSKEFSKYNTDNVPSYVKDSPCTLIKYMSDSILSDISEQYKTPVFFTYEKLLDSFFNNSKKYLFKNIGFITDSKDQMDKIDKFKDILVSKTNTIIDKLEKSDINDNLRMKVIRKIKYNTDYCNKEISSAVNLYRTALTLIKHIEQVRNKLLRITNKAKYRLLEVSKNKHNYEAIIKAFSMFDSM